jgi:outer membrane protein with glycine zipper
MLQKNTHPLLNPETSANPSLVGLIEHPLGLGIGAAGGALAGAVFGSSIAFPFGTVLGAAVGAATGALVGHGTAVTVNPAKDDL